MTYPLPRRRAAFLAVAAIAALGLLPVTGRAADEMPSAADQEVLIRNTLLTFNDANLTGNYTVLAARAAKPFQEQVPAEKMKEIFKAFANGAVDISRAATGKLTPTEPSKIDDDVLILVGTVQIASDYVANYTLKYIKLDGRWQLLGINVKTT